MMSDPASPQPPTPRPPASSWSAWQGQVDSEAALAACIADLGILPLRGAAPWPSLLEVRAAGLSLAEAWKWGGALVARRQVFCGRVLGGTAELAFTTLPLFIAAFALAPGADYTRVYMAGQINMTAKAVADLLFSRGPLKTQQIRQSLRLHKRFLAHDVPAALAQLERALLIVAGGPELAASWEAPRPPTEEAATPPAAPRSRWSRQIAHDLDLRVWELTARWAPPETLAAADRLREHPAVAQATLAAAARALVPGAGDAAIRDWFGWSTLPPPVAGAGG
jgi:hypothetical protein